MVGTILFGDDPNTEKWRLRRAFLKIHRMYFVEQPAAFLPAKKIKQNYIENSSKEMEKKNTKSGQCLEISCANIFQPRIPAHLIRCILHTACTLFPGTHLKYNPAPYLRKLTIAIYSYIYIYHKPS